MTESYMPEVEQRFHRYVDACYEIAELLRNTEAGQRITELLAESEKDDEFIKKIVPTMMDFVPVEYCGCHLREQTRGNCTVDEDKIFEANGGLLKTFEKFPGAFKFDATTAKKLGVLGVDENTVSTGKHYAVKQTSKDIKEMIEGIQRAEKYAEARNAKLLSQLDAENASL